MQSRLQTRKMETSGKHRHAQSKWYQTKITRANTTAIKVMLWEATIQTTLYLPTQVPISSPSVPPLEQ